MIWYVLSGIAFILAALPAMVFLHNLFLYRVPPPADRAWQPTISVLIPARNEEHSIGEAVESVLRSTGVQLQVIVMDDASTDRTVEMVRKLTTIDARVRLAIASPLPSGWNGKQHACWALAQQAEYEIFCFLDADVRIHPEALARMASFLRDSKAELVSGFPRQIAGTWMEQLLLPLIHFVLLGFLPVASMRRSTSPAYAAGCGQFFMVHGAAYFASGGHAAIRSTMHDGLLLPRSFREHGYRTDLADITPLATCRMYQNAGEVWRGLSKNATEGLAAPARIVPVTALLFAGQVMPILLLTLLLIKAAPFSTATFLPQGASLVWILPGAALFFSYLPRMVGVLRFKQSVWSALLHPIGISVLLVLQWTALLRKLAGKQAVWKQRECKVG